MRIFKSSLSSQEGIPKQILMSDPLIRFLEVGWVENFQNLLVDIHILHVVMSTALTGANQIFLLIHCDFCPRGLVFSIN